MKAILLSFGIFFLVSLSFSGLGQPVANTEKKIRRHFPANYSVNRLTKKLTKDCTQELEKVQAISSWIAKNIRYDVKAYLSLTIKTYAPNKILRRRKAVCSGYSDLFVAMCGKAGIKAFGVQGYDKGFEYKTGDVFYFDQHEWNAVKIDSAYYLMDLTWASGYIEKRKRSFRKFLYRNFHVPYLANKIKFAKKYNADYIMTPAELFVADHLPCHPMWQLKKEITSVKAFEKPGAEHIKRDSIDFRYHILQYSSMASAEKIIHIGDVSKIFNTSNNQNIAFAYGRVASATMKIADERCKKNPSLISHYSYLLNYFDTASFYLKNYQADNNVVHRIKIDSIEKRNRIIKDYAFRSLRTNMGKSAENRRTINMLKRGNIMADLQSKRIIEGNERAVDVSIVHERRPAKENVKSKERIKENKKKIELNNKRIDSLLSVLETVNTAIDVNVDSTSAIFQEIETAYRIAGNYIKLSTEETIQYEKLSNIKYDHLMIDSMSVLKNSFYKRIALVERGPMAANSYKRDSINKAVVRLIASNRATIRSIKKASPADNREDEFFYSENDRLFSAMNKTLDKLEQRKLLNEIKIDRLKSENFYIKTENKEYKKQLVIQRKWRAAMIKKEDYRYKIFKGRGLSLEKKCFQASEDLKVKLGKLKE